MTVAGYSVLSRDALLAVPLALLTFLSTRLQSTSLFAQVDKSTVFPVLHHRLAYESFPRLPPTTGGLWAFWHTTRGPRPDEIDAKDYHFTSPAAFRTLLQAGAFIEYAEFSGNMYGTSRQAVRDVARRGRRCVLEIEAQGIRQLKQTDLNPVFVFLSPPSVGALRERLRDRGTESDAAIQQRLATCLKEIEYAREPGAHDIVLVLNDYEKSYQDFRKVAFGERIVGDILPALND
ncbi:hypothetical protein HWV62_861 [Athelia sp. TMB]|nr:hypothetical protein HWV62_861 [Athelia sp. TMB]